VRTDDFIAMLAADTVPPWRFGRVLGIAVAGGVLLAAVLFFVRIGFRPDIAEALASVRFLFKFVVTIALAITATRAVAALGRPGKPAFRQVIWLAIVPALLLGGAIAELLALPERQWMPNLVGHNARFCLTLIPLLAIGPLTCFVIALRHAAPSNPGLAGAVAGLAASGIAATFYAANCNDDSPLFVMLWYSIAVLMVTAAGYLVGRKLLRW
jgi:hypothetical protein